MNVYKRERFLVSKCSGLYKTQKESAINFEILNVSRTSQVNE